MNSHVKAVILASSQKPEDIIAALKVGACGFLSQHIPGDRLLRSLELIALGEMALHPPFVWSQPAANENQDIGDLNGGSSFIEKKDERNLRKQLESSRSGEALAATSENQTGNVVPSLSRREMLILRMLIHGASNKVIARNLVITESTVKVHMKAILRKLRLQNRTQAAIWARNHANDGDWNVRTAAATPAH